MKPYRETHTFEGVLDAPIERVWALHTNPGEMLSVFSRILDTEVVAGRPGEVGCIIRSTMQTPRGRVGHAETEVIEVNSPRRLVVRVTVREAPRISRESIRTFQPEDGRTRTVLTVSAQSVPIPWIVRVGLRCSRALRAQATAAQFKSETAEENAYYARGSNTPRAH